MTRRNRDRRQARTRHPSSAVQVLCCDGCFAPLETMPIIIDVPGLYVVVCRGCADAFAAEMENAGQPLDWSLRPLRGA